MAAIRLPVDSDIPAIDSFLARHSATSMFLRANLAEAGLADTGEPVHGTWMCAFDNAGAVAGVACHFWNGNIILQAPGPELPELICATAAGSPRDVKGLLGPWSQAVAAREALGLPDVPTQLCSRETLFHLRLDDLHVPALLRDKAVTMRLATPDDLPWLMDWFAVYEQEALSLTIEESHGPAARNRRSESLGRRIRRREKFLLERDGEVVAASAFNSSLPDCVQIGGVFTPPELRGRGYARAVVAASLLRAQTEGVRESILFTGEENIPAIRAYEGIGYRNVGDYAIIVFRDAHAAPA